MDDISDKKEKMDEISDKNRPLALKSIFALV